MRLKKTFTIVAITSRDDHDTVDIQEGITAEELTARLANKPEGVEYHVFAGDEIRYQLRQVVEFDKPRRRPIRNVDPAVDKPKRGRKAAPKAANGVGGEEKAVES